jgi:hypothetical protein
MSGASCIRAGKIQVQRLQSTFDKQVLDDQPVIFDDDLRLGIALQLCQQLIGKTINREGSVGELPGVRHVPDPVVLLDQMIAIDNLLPGHFLRRGKAITYQFEDIYTSMTMPRAPGLAR